MRRVLLALWPALLLALFGGWCGTFYYGAAASAVIAGHLALLVTVAWGWRGWDPLRLGARGKALLPLVWLWFLLAMRASPASRAGWLAVSLLPAFLALPSAVARCWREEEARRRGLLALAIVAGLAGATAIAGMIWQGSARAAQPLGNAVVLGSFLATLTPLVLAVALSARGRLRVVAWTVLVLALAGLLGTRSVAAIAAVVVGAAIALPRGRRRWLLVPLLAGVLVLGSRLGRLATGEDGSLQARTSYWLGGLRGIAERPLFGWGPGSTAWTLAPFARPRPGANPPGEALVDLHSLPLQLGYELGLPGLALVGLLAGAFGLARLREAPREGEADLRRGALAGLAAGGTALLAGPTLGTTAPWLALAVVAGAALATAAPAAEEPAVAPAGDTSPPNEARMAAPPSARARPWTPLSGRRLGWLYAAIALLLLLPLDAAIACYDAARRSAPERARRLVALAAELDPQLPLYRARLGWLAASAHERANALAAAAAAAPGVPALQLAAGWAAEVAAGDGERQLELACAGDPLFGAAPFLLVETNPRAPWAPRLGARALLADPPLLAAIFWEAEPQLLTAALGEAARWEGVDMGFREVLLNAATSLPRTGRIDVRRFWVDDERNTETSIHVSLYAFRRLPWRALLGEVPVRADAAYRMDGLTGAGSLPSTRLDAFAPSCLPAAEAAFR